MLSRNDMYVKSTSFCEKPFPGKVSGEKNHAFIIKTCCHLALSMKMSVAENLNFAPERTDRRIDLNFRTVYVTFHCTSMDKNHFVEIPFFDLAPAKTRGFFGFFWPINAWCEGWFVDSFESVVSRCILHGKYTGKKFFCQNSLPACFGVKKPKPRSLGILPTPVSQKLFLVLWWGMIIFFPQTNFPLLKVWQEIFGESLVKIGVDLPSWCSFGLWAPMLTWTPEPGNDASKEVGKGVNYIHTWNWSPICEIPWGDQRKRFGEEIIKSLDARAKTRTSVCKIPRLWAKSWDFADTQ